MGFSGGSGNQSEVFESFLNSFEEVL